MILPMLHLRDISYQPRGLGPLSLSLRAGEIVLLCGPSGSGKSTLCAILDGELEATSGELSREPGAERLALLGSDFEAQLLGSTVGQELALGRDGRSEPGDSPLLGLWEGRESEDPHDLSAGEQQLLLLTCLATGPARFLLVDEALSCLDEASFRLVAGALRELADSDRGVLIVSHEVRLLALVDRCVGLVEGRLVFDLPVDQMAEPQLDLVRIWRGSRGRAPGESDFLAGGGQRDREILLSSPAGAVELASGECLTLAGVTGSGKSRWLMAAAGLLRVEGWRRESDLAFALLRQRAVSLMQRRTVEAELECSLLEGERRGGVRLSLEELSDVPRAWWDRSPRSLSQGQARFLANLCLLLQRPELLLLDQPFSGLDADLRERLVRRLALYLEAGGRLVLATHRPEEMVLYGHKLLVLEKGETTYHGFPWGYFEAQPDPRLGFPTH